MTTGGGQISMPEAVTPLSIAAAAVLAQFLLFVIISIGALILHLQGEGHYGALELVLVLVFSIPAIGAVVFTDQFVAAWQSTMPPGSVPALPWHSGIFAAFAIDIILVALLVQLSGGAQQSAFTPVLFLLLPLAIFLREPIDRLLLYLATISGLFTMTALRKPVQIPFVRPLAFWFVSLACFLLGTVIGIATRPT